MAVSDFSHDIETTAEKCSQRSAIPDETGCWKISISKSVVISVGCLESQWSGQWSVLSSVLSGIACLSDDFPSDLRAVEIVKTSQTKAVRGVTSRHGNFSSEFPVFPLLRVSRKPGATFKISTVEQQQQQQRGNKLRGRAEK